MHNVYNRDVYSGTNISKSLYIRLKLRVHWRQNTSRENASTVFHLAHTLAKYERVGMLRRQMNYNWNHVEATSAKH